MEVLGELIDVDFFEQLADGFGAHFRDEAIGAEFGLGVLELVFGQGLHFFE